MQRGIAAAFIVFICSGVIATAVAHDSAAAPQTAWRQPEILDEIHHFRRQTWRWQRVMSAPLTRTSANRTLQAQSAAYQRWVRDLWRRRAIRARRIATNPPHKAAWLCIQRHEGSWRDPNPPYWGGLQMDWNFMATYGARLLRAKGPANNWTPLEQMWVAERAWRAGRGFYPWPNTARMCGLI